jgi:hypothetical protein
MGPLSSAVGVAIQWLDDDGVAGRGERFVFGRLRGMTRVFLEGKPEATGGFDLAGASEHFGGYSCAAGVHVVAPEALGPLAEELHHSLAGVPGRSPRPARPNSTGR